MNKLTPQQIANFAKKGGCPRCENRITEFIMNDEYDVSNEHFHCEKCGFRWEEVKETIAIKAEKWRYEMPSPTSEMEKELAKALKDLLGSQDLFDPGEYSEFSQCRWCGRTFDHDDTYFWPPDADKPKNCPSDDCPGHNARTILAKLEEE